jgi:dCMP deaminase
MSRPDKNLLMMAHAVLVSRMSTCDRKHVGCVMTDERYEQLVVGYNGSYRGGPNGCLHPEVSGGCGCLHAEINACIKARFVPTKAFVTVAPCRGCAVALINSGVREVYFAREFKIVDGVETLREAKVLLKQFDILPCELLRDFSLDLRNEATYGWSAPRS